MFDQLPVVLTSRDFALLENLVHQWGEPFAGAGEVVRRKLAAATLVFPADVPADVVTLNSRIRFRTRLGKADERVLVAGPSEEIYGMTVLLASPGGLALIGAAVGHTVEARRRDGSPEQLFIEALPYQPERTHVRPASGAVSGRALN
jgi:regulator of nucleoside diphosphate kinase